MRFCVLKAGTATRATRERLGDFGDLFVDLLALPGQRWEIFDVEHGVFPPSLSAFNGVVITGSPASAYDPEPWILRLLEAVRSCHKERVPLLGVCFGLQAVAQALGGEVRPNPAGWDVGLTELIPTETGRTLPPLAGAREPLRMLEVHQDIATRPPPGSVVLASSDRTPCEIFTLGDRVLCVQGHPEMDNTMIRELIEKRARKGLIDPRRAREGLASLEALPHREIFQAWLRTFLREGRLPVAA
jgi:GMP synthase-like glutamine amidotransferase